MTGFGVCEVDVFAGYDCSLSLPTHPAVIATVTAMERATAGSGHTPLSAPAYLYVFPVLVAVLKWPSHTPLHDAALNVVALHVDPERDVPRAASLDMLYSMLSGLATFRWAPPDHDSVTVTRCLNTVWHDACGSRLGTARPMNNS